MCSAAGDPAASARSRAAANTGFARCWLASNRSAWARSALAACASSAIAAICPAPARSACAIIVSIASVLSAGSVSANSAPSRGSSTSRTGAGLNCRARPSTRSSGYGSFHPRRLASASCRISVGRVASTANATSRPAAAGVPSRRFAFSARRTITSLRTAGVSTSAASAGNAPGIDVSSWIARAASSTTVPSASFKNSATFAEPCRRKATTLISRNGTDARSRCFASWSAVAHPVSPTTAAWRMTGSVPSFSANATSASTAAGTASFPSAIAAWSRTRGALSLSSGINFSAAAFAACGASPRILAVCPRSSGSASASSGNTPATAAALRRNNWP